MNFLWLHEVELSLLIMIIININCNMSIMKTKHPVIVTKKRPKGFWILIGLAVLLNIIYLFGQTMAIVDYDFAVLIGLQEPENEITKIGVAINKGFGLGDTLVYMPIFIMGIIGLLKRSAFGFYAMCGAMAITVYWPIVSLSTLFFAEGAEGWYFTDYTSYSALLSLIALYGIWGFWYLYKNRDLF